ncbi:hypothetical protein RUM43_000367 [Polyplax serrata]|uniref:Uncharacterized protein n=1 Tax=Polyplax serrata TaxID=468196 RepID=A0AAN8SFU5_POLSC
MDASDDRKRFFSVVGKIQIGRKDERTDGRKEGRKEVETTTMGVPLAGEKILMKKEEKKLGKIEKDRKMTETVAGSSDSVGTNVSDGYHSHPVQLH